MTGPNPAGFCKWVEEKMVSKKGTYIPILQPQAIRVRRVSPEHVYSGPGKACLKPQQILESHRSNLVSLGTMLTQSSCRKPWCLQSHLDENIWRMRTAFLLWLLPATLGERGIMTTEEAAPVLQSSRLHSSVMQLGQVASPLFASASPSVQWDLHTYLTWL